MMKLLTDEWVAAEIENKQLRNEKREEFWNELGVNRTRGLEEMDIPPAERLANIQKLLSEAGNKLNDPGLVSIAGLATMALASVAPGSLPFKGAGQPLRIEDLTVYARSQFFSTDVVPIFEITRMS